MLVERVMVLNRRVAPAELLKAIDTLPCGLPKSGKLRSTDAVALRLAVDEKAYPPVSGTPQPRSSTLKSTGDSTP